MRVGVAGVPGAWSSERMVDALRDAGIDSFAFALKDCLHDVSGRTVAVDDFLLNDLDAIVVKKIGDTPSPSARLRLHMLRDLELQGVRIFSRPSVMDRAMDRYRMTMQLVEAGLPVPDCYAVESEACLGEAARRLGDAVVKPVYTSKGRGFARLSDASTERPPDRTDGLEGSVLAQRFVNAPGRDIGACVLGGEYVGAFYRVAKAGEWLTTTAAGGRYEPCDLPAGARSLAEEASAVFGLDYTVVDLVETGMGYLIYEVSAFGGFRGLWEAYRFDVAREYGHYIQADLRF